jgi:hypothetical protein
MWTPRKVGAVAVRAGARYARVGLGKGAEQAVVGIGETPVSPISLGQVVEHRDADPPTLPIPDVGDCVVVAE